MNSALKVANYAKKNQHVQQSVAIIEEAIQRYGLGKICTSFNGGKDCTVVLHLVNATIRNLNLGSKSPNQNNNNDINSETNNHHTSDLNKLLAFYHKTNDIFEEEEKFVNQALVTYNLKLAHYSGTSLKDSLRQFKSDYPFLEGIFIGTRFDDLKEGQKLAYFAPTDHSWPSFVRINPILEWSYQQVWDFIRHLEIPYCDLYNQGYSSFGAKSESRRNSSLLRHDFDGKSYYMPAWCLADHQDERHSRS